jgi:hypothetical protein
VGGLHAAAGVDFQAGPLGRTTSGRLGIHWAHTKAACLDIHFRDDELKLADERRANFEKQHVNSHLMYPTVCLAHSRAPWLSQRTELPLPMSKF